MLATRQPTLQSVEASVGYFILVSIWSRLIRQTEKDQDAIDIVNGIRNQMWDEMDLACFAALSAFSTWKSTDLEEWRRVTRHR